MLRVCVVLIALVALSGCAVAIPEKPTNITTTGATLNAEVSTSIDGPVDYWFRYGTTDAYGTDTPHRTIVLDEGDDPAPVSEPISGLSANTRYHWQACAQDSEEDPPRAICSTDQTFEGHNVACGETITRSIYVTNDLQACKAGLVIGAAGITLDLNGHTIDGDPTGQGSGTGVSNSAGFDGVTIQNGTLQDFSLAGVHLEDAAGNRVRGLNVVGALAQGIDIGGASANTVIEGNEADAIGVALRIRASGVHAEDNTVSGVGLTSSEKTGPLVVLGNDNRIEGNRPKLIHIDGIGRGVGRGALIVVGDRNQVLGNTANDSVLNGIVIEPQAANTLLRGNRAHNNGHEFSFGDGILVESASTSIGDNSANLNAGLGISAIAGVTDLGGNSANGNGNSLQCQNVFCQ